MRVEGVIRILHIIHQLGVGGAENGIVNLVNQMNPAEFDTGICTFSGGGSLTGRLDRFKTDLFELNKRNGNDPLLILRLGRKLRKWKPNIVHTHSWGTLVEGILGSKLAGVPIVVHGEHGTIQRKPLNLFIQRLFWHMADQILSVSSAHRERISEVIKYPQNKIKVVLNGVDTMRFKPNLRFHQIREELGLNRDQTLIGTVGRLVPVKNHRFLLHAFAKLCEQCDSCWLAIVGDGPLEKDLKQISQDLGIGSRVFMMGLRTDMPPILQAFDIFVLPSISEGMSNIILEAMSTALPVVATNVGGNPDIVQDGVNGRIVELGDIGGLSRILGELLEQKNSRKSLGEQARKMILTRFGLSVMVRNYEKLYRDLYAAKTSRK